MLWYSSDGETSGPLHHSPHGEMLKKLRNISPMHDAKVFDKNAPNKRKKKQGKHKFAGQQQTTTAAEMREQVANSPIEP
jgi:hypothetical protein